MSTPLLVTKLYIPPPGPKVVRRARLVERLNEGLHRKLTLISAPAGFGKTTLVSEWVADNERLTAWLSLDEADNDRTRFLTYLTAALQTVAANVGSGILNVLQSPQPPSTEAILTTLLNEIAALPDEIILVLDDYHAIDAKPVDDGIAFLLDHLPPRMHLVMTTREDPRLSLARLRARGQMTELRAADMRFAAAEAAEFLNPVMGLDLSEADVAALEDRTEGWIAGLQLAAISMQGHVNPTRFIQSFSGSHRFVLDYLVEEVLHRQSARIQTFLLRTSILDRLSGPLCDAVLGDPSASGQNTLEYIESANLFLVPLDDERRWYRYHHLFAELLRQRLHQGAASSTGNEAADVAELHVRASTWFELAGLEIEAFRHAAAANDLARAERLIEGKGVPLYVRGGAAPVLNWLDSLPASALDARPSLWVMLATVLSIFGQMTRVEPKLQAAEGALQDVAPDDGTRNLIARIAALRSMLALMAADPRQIEAIISQSRRALACTTAGNPPGRAAGLWQLGIAHQLQGDRSAARLAHIEAISISEASGNNHINILATTSLGYMRELDGQLRLASETYRRVLQLVGEPPGPIACEAYVGLARIVYEWNDLDLAEQHGLLSVRLARQLEIASFVSSELFLARLNLARGDTTGAIAILAQTEQDALERQFLYRIPEIAAVQAFTCIREGNVKAAAHLAETHELPVAQARVHLARGEPSKALAVLELFREHVEAKGWTDERLRVLILQAVAHDACGEREEALQLLVDALAQTETEGFIRTFLDEGAPMAKLLSGANAAGIKPDYTGRLLAAFETEGQKFKPHREPQSHTSSYAPIEPLSPRELEVLRLIAQGLSNHEISERLFLALSTVKGHNRVIFGKLQVQRRTEAVARARDLGLL